MKYTINKDNVAVDTEVSFYRMDDCPLGVKVQLLNQGGVAIYGVVNTRKDASSLQGWRPLPKGIKND